MSGEKLDLFKLHKDQYRAVGKPILVDIPRASYLCATGRGAPGSEAFHEAMGALYGMAYTVKMTRKSEGLGDYVIGKLEGQYWTESGKDLGQVDPDEWSWQFLIRTPDAVESDDLASALDKLIARGKAAGCEAVELIRMEMGRCVQMLHVGPYDQEHRTLQTMLEFAAAQGLEPRGRHHEIYLSDPRRVTPEKLRTILRRAVG